MSPEELIIIKPPFSVVYVSSVAAAPVPVPVAEAENVDIDARRCQFYRECI